MKGFYSLDNKKMDEVRNRTLETAKKALWEEFIQYYYEAYSIALINRDKRLKKTPENTSNTF